MRRLLETRGTAIAAIDPNRDTVRRLHADDLTAIYGDVLRPGTLGEWGIEIAGSLILSTDIADTEDAAEIRALALML